MKIEYKWGMGFLTPSDQEKKDIEEIRERWLNMLNDYVITEREDIIESVSLHMTNDAKKYELINLRYQLLNDPALNKAYFETATIENNSIKIDPAKFLEFAIGYNLLDDEAKGFRVLIHVIKVHLMKWIIDNDFNPKKNVEVIITSNVTTELEKAKYNHIFKGDGLESFDYLNDNFHLADDAPTVKYTLIYYCLLSEIDCTKKAYREFIREYCSNDLNGSKFARLSNTETNSYSDLENRIKAKYKAR